MIETVFCTTKAPEWSGAYGGSEDPLATNDGHVCHYARPDGVPFQIPGGRNGVHHLECPEHQVIELLELFLVARLGERVDAVLASAVGTRHELREQEVDD